MMTALERFRSIARFELKDDPFLWSLNEKALALGKASIDGEIEKARELLAYGGFFPNADHDIPPDVSYENLQYFLKRLKALRR